MANGIQQNQVGNLILPGDPDILTEEDLKAGEIPPETPQPKSEQELGPEPAEAAPGKKPRPIQNYEAELARRREREDRLARDLKERDEALTTLREENLRFKARQDLEREAQEKIEKAKHAQERPDPEVDPYGARLWDLEENSRQQKEITRRMEERERQLAAQGQVDTAIREITAFLESDVANFKTAHADISYEEASNHVYQKYLEFWQATGLNSQEAQAVVANTFLAVGKAAQVRGKSAAQAIYNLAKMTGWNTEEKTPSTPSPKPAGNAQEKIARIAKAQKLQGLGGKVPSERTPEENLSALSAEELANLSDDDYLRYKQDPRLGPLLMRRLEELG